jgi:formylglycine-generating enzyme required for sulfatase activity
MKRLFRSGRGAAAVSAVAALGGCTALLGVDEDYRRWDGGAAGGATSTNAASSSGTGTGGASGVGTLGDPCPVKGALACAEGSKKSKLVCGPENTWASNGTCDGATVCDTTADPGTCKEVVAECVGKSAGDVFCTGVTRVACGPDLVTTEVVETCPYVCSAGKCTGVCVPLTDKQCAGNQPQSCDASGAWQDGAACSAQMPACNAGACGVAPSCSGLASTCGPSGNESCCAIGAIPGGTFNRGNDANYPATVSAFRLDRFEITVGRFRHFMASYPGNKPVAGAGAHPLIAGSGWQAAWDASLAANQAALKTAVSCDATYQTWTDMAGGNENKPMNCLDWYEAFAFCAWDGGRLATEAEWNYAAAGGSEQRVYPWGAGAPDNAHAVYDCTGDGSAADSCAATDILNVGAKSTVGDGKWGQADLAGGVWEWNLDWYGDSYIATCSDCAIVSKSTVSGRVVRGGSWHFDASVLLSSVRFNNGPTDHGNYLGARCARAP